MRGAARLSTPLPSLPYVFTDKIVGKTLLVRFLYLSKSVQSSTLTTSWLSKLFSVLTSPLKEPLDFSQRFCPKLFSFYTSETGPRSPPLSTLEHATLRLTVYAVNIWSTEDGVDHLSFVILSCYLYACPLYYITTGAHLCFFNTLHSISTLLIFTSPPSGELWLPSFGSHSFRFGKAARGWQHHVTPRCCSLFPFPSFFSPVLKIRFLYTLFFLDWCLLWVETHARDVHTSTRARVVPPPCC